MQVKLRKTLATATFSAALMAFSAAAGLAQAQVAAPTPAAPAATPAAAPAPAGQAPVDVETYLLGNGDVVEITVVGGTDGPMRVQIQSDGTILLPLIGSVDAGGKTVLQLRNMISEKLKAGGYYTTPAVNVAVISYTSRYVTVLGEVARPGPVPIERSYRLSDILARVGGVRDVNAKIVKLRREDGTELTLNAADIAIGGPNEDPVIKAGDKIFVPTPQMFYVLGQVSRPGNYPMEAGMTMRKALAVAGGVTQLGSIKKVKIIRKGEELKKYDPDDVIQVGDVIDVGERFF